MPDLTPNLGLKKPTGNERVTRANYTENLDIMDTAAVKKGAGIAELIGGTLEDRPEPEVIGRYYFAQDTGAIYLDTGEAWVLAAASQGDITALQTEVMTHKADYTLQVPYAEATGTTNIYSVTLNPAPISLVNGLALAVKIPMDSTSTSTLNVNSLGAVGIKKANGVDVTNLKAGGIYTLRYDGVNFILQGEGASGNATASDLLSGKTATTDAGEITGTMPNRGAVSQSLAINNTYTIPEGYHNGSGQVTQSIPTKGAATITPGTTNQTIAAGQYLTGNQTIVGSTNLVANNIKQGVNIFGVVGSLMQWPAYFKYLIRPNYGFIGSPDSYLPPYYVVTPTCTWGTDYGVELRDMGGNSAYLFYIVTDSAIDLTNVNTLTIEWAQTGTDAAIAALAVSTTKLANYTLNNKIIQKTGLFDRRIDTLDVSALSGSFYIRIHGDHGGTTSTPVIKVYNLSVA